MVNRIARILLLSDSHCMVVPPWKQKGQTDKGFAGRIIEFPIAIWKIFNFHFFVKAIKRVGKMGRFDKIIYCGDLAECVYNERGMKTERDIKEMERFKAHIELGIDVERENIHYLPGDHELGYILPLSSDPGGGVSWKSINNFKSVFGPLFSGFSIRDFHFFLLSSSILMQKSKDFKFQKLKKEQLRMFDGLLAGIPEGRNVFIFSHDPDGLQEIQGHFDTPFFGSYYLRNKNFHAFCGHMYAESSLAQYEKLGKIANAKTLRENFFHWLPSRFEKGRKVMEWAKANLFRMEIFRKYDLQIVPSTAGMMGKGGGFLILNLFDDGTYFVEKYKI